MLRRLTLLSLLALGLAAVAVNGAESLSRYAKVVIPPVKTSIYIGSVTLHAPSFVRRDDRYSSSYTAKVFPYFFYNEKGTLWIEVTDAMLEQLGRGEAIEFTGEGMSSDGEPRAISGKATPTDSVSGKIKVRVSVSKKIQLIFNTTYRFGD